MEAAPTDSLIEIRQIENDSSLFDDVRHCNIWWRSESYAEYRMLCDIEGLEPLYTEREFNDTRKMLAETNEGEIPPIL